MKVNVKNTSGTTIEELDLRDDIFGIEPNTAVMHQALVRQLANQRLGTHHAKTRAEVSRTTAKWFRQKGTGRARHGSRKAPIFVGGGKAHGPVPRDYTQKMPRKMRRLALRSALSAKAAAEQIIVLDKLVFDQPKTVEVLQLLDNLQVSGSAVILLPERNENVEKSARNLENVKTIRAGYLNIRDLLGHSYVIIPKDAVTQIESFLG
ncbi:MAG: 50S ribosomal protein L4 [Anaerolineales bacterium]|nr:50S ribosomal protein L4 [Anaerolineales bacterium]